MSFTGTSFHRGPVSAAVFLLAFGIFSSVATSLSAQRPTSVEQLSAMLDSIDPYLPDQDAKGTIKVIGSTSMDAMAHGWTAGFKEFHKGVEVEIHGASEEEVFERLVKDPSAIGMLSRPVTEAELEELKRKGLKKPTSFVVAREALGVFVHPSNPIQTISPSQLRQVFTTADSSTPPTWSALGATGEWAKRPIRVVSRTEASGTQRFLKDFVFNNTEMRNGVSSHVSNAQVLTAVAEDPQAIAICGLRCNLKSVKPLQLVAGASVIPSDDHAILIGQYPLTRPLSLILDVGSSDANAKASQEFVHYALCKAGQTKAITVGFFPVDLPLLRAGLQKLGAHQLR